MQYNKHNLAVAKLASKGAIKRSIRGVLFTTDKTVATDSFRLLEVSVPKGAVVEARESFLADARNVGDIKINKDESVNIKEVGEKFVSFALANGNTHNAERIEETFPVYEGIFPTGDPIAEINVNARYLAEVLAIIAKITPLEQVRMRLYGADKPIVLDVSGDQPARAMVMPVKI